MMNKLVREKLLQAGWQAPMMLLAAFVVGLSVNGVRRDRLPLFVPPPSIMESALGQGAASAVISPEEAEALFLANMAIFVDARPRELYLEGHIKEAKSLPYEDFKTRFEDVMADAPHDATIVTYCDGEDCTLSEHLALSLMEKGYTDVRVLMKGWTTWSGLGLPTEAGK